MSKNQRGFGIVLVSMAIAAIGLFGMIGGLIYSKRNESTQKQTNPTQILEEKNVDKRYGGTLLLKKECPDEWIDNRMPSTVGDDNGASQYFIINGERKEISEYDVEWIENNCAVKIQPVY